MEGLLVLGSVSPDMRLHLCQQWDTTSHLSVVPEKLFWADRKQEKGNEGQNLVNATDLILFTVSAMRSLGMGF